MIRARAGISYTLSGGRQTGLKSCERYRGRVLRVWALLAPSVIGAARIAALPPPGAPPEKPVGAGGRPKAAYGLSTPTNASLGPEVQSYLADMAGRKS